MMRLGNEHAVVNLVEQVFVFSMGLLILLAVYVTFEQVERGFEQNRRMADSDEIAAHISLVIADLHLIASVGNNASVSRTVTFAKLDKIYTIELSGDHVLVESDTTTAERKIPAPINSSGKAYSDGRIVISYSSEGKVILETG